MNYTSTGSGTRDQGRVRWVSCLPKTKSGLEFMYYGVNQLGWPDRLGWLTPPQGAVPCSACGILGEDFL